MGIWFYLVNDTRKERVKSNYGQWDTFDPTLEWRRALEQIPKWSEQDSCRWVDNVAEYVSLPLPESYPFEDISAVFCKKMTDDAFREKHGEYSKLFSAYWRDRNMIEFDDEGSRENVIKSYKRIPLPTTTRGRSLQPTIAKRDESPKRESTSSPPPLEPSQVLKQLEAVLERVCSQIDEESAHTDMLMLDHLYRVGKHLKIFG